MSNYSQDIPDPIATLNLGDSEKIAASYEKCVADIIEFIKTESGKGFTFTVEGDHEHKRDGYIPLTPDVDESPTGAYTIAITDGTRTEAVGHAFERCSAHDSHRGFSPISSGASLVDMP